MHGELMPAMRRQSGGSDLLDGELRHGLLSCSLVSLVRCGGGRCPTYRLRRPPVAYRPSSFAGGSGLAGVMALAMAIAWCVAHHIGRLDLGWWLMMLAELP